MKFYFKFNGQHFIFLTARFFVSIKNNNNNCVSTKSLSSFENLLLFSYRAFNVAEKSDKSLNKHIKENLSNFEVPQIRTGSKKRTNLSLAKKVEAKVANFDIRGAVKLLSSDDSLASFNEDVAEELKKTSFTISRTFFPRPFQTRRH
jgi:hypothetical protein